MPNEEKIIENLRKCPRFGRCSVNICPLDSEAQKRTYVSGEDICPFIIKRRGKDRKGIRTQAPDSILKVISESNFKMLNKGNQKRWHSLHKKDGEK